jgi:hypothetical protein
MKKVYSGFPQIFADFRDLKSPFGLRVNWITIYFFNSLQTATAY